MHHNSRRYIVTSPGKAPFPAVSGQVSYQNTPTPSEQLYALPHSLLNFLPTAWALQALVNTWLIRTPWLIAQTAPEALPNVKKKKWNHSALISCVLSCCCSSKPVVFSFTTVSRPLYPLLMPGLTLRICSLFWVQIGAEQWCTAAVCCISRSSFLWLPTAPRNSLDSRTQIQGKNKDLVVEKKHQTTTFKTSSSLLGEKAWLLKSTSK